MNRFRKPFRKPYAEYSPDLGYLAGAKSPRKEDMLTSRAIQSKLYNLKLKLPQDYSPPAEKVARENSQFPQNP